MDSPDAPREVKLVLVTFPDTPTAESVGRAVVDERLAACASTVPGVRSRYWWKGNVETADEVVMLLKTSASRVPDLERRITELHPYEVPEFLVLATEHASAAYAHWVASHTSPGETQLPPGKGST
jgi:periplasmic divalent cation tolerance protein